MERLYSLDTLKFICAILVIFIHIPTPYTDFLLPLTRVAVPVFFMISGFFIYTDSGKMDAKFGKTIRHMLYICLWGSGLYFLWTLYIGWTTGDWSAFTLKAVIDFLLFNENPFGGHLWYISAYIYVLVIARVFNRFHRIKLLWWFIPLLLLGDLVLGKYSLLLIGREYPYIYVRNFLFVGLPYFALGMWIKAHKAPLLRLGVPVWGWLIAVVLFAVTSYAERAMLVSWDLNATRDHYLSTTFCAIALFMVFLSINQRKPTTLSIIGQLNSLYIYILHPLAYALLARVNNLLPSPAGGIFPWLSPLLVCMALVPMIYMFKKVKFLR